MTAAYRDPNPDRTGHLLRALEQQQRLGTPLDLYVTWPALDSINAVPSGCPESVDITQLHALLPLHAPRAALAQRRGDAGTVRQAPALGWRWELLTSAFALLVLVALVVGVGLLLLLVYLIWHAVAAVWP